MTIYIVHPEHGEHVVYTNDELKRHQEKGWKVREEPKPTVAQAVIESAKRKPGRPRKER